MSEIIPIKNKLNQIRTFTILWNKAIGVNDWDLNKESFTFMPDQECGVYVHYHAKNLKI